MIVERFEPARHLEQVNEWAHARGVGRYEVDWLPKNGFIVQGHAAVWLFCTDSPFAWTDSTISNHVKHPDRDNAIQLLLAATVERARELGFKVVIGFASEQMKRHTVAAGYADVDGRTYHAMMRRI